MADYTGLEAGIDLSLGDGVESDSWFDVRPQTVPDRATPVFDEDLGVVIGYRHESTTGVFKLYDLNGTQIGIEELPLESPLIDPLDLIFVVGGVFRSAFRGLGRGAAELAGSSARRAIALSGGRLSARALAASVAALMRSTWRGLAMRPLKFTATTSARMGVRGRHVPVHILQLAIRHGRRNVDPQGVKGAFEYTSKMIRNGKEYTLQVVVRESDWTILHFHYF